VGPRNRRFRQGHRTRSERCSRLGARGYAYGKKGDFGRAIADSDHAIGLDPNGASSYELRGEVYSDKGEWDHAIDDFTKAMALDPEYGRTYCYCHRGVAHMAKGNWDSAIEDFTKAIAVGPKRTGYYDNRGISYLNKGEVNRAIDDFTKAIGLDPKDAKAHILRGGAYLKKGDTNRAIEDYTKAIDFDSKMLPPTAHAVRLLGSKEITTTRLRTTARRSSLMLKALLCGTLAVGRVQLPATWSRRYRTVTSRWTWNPTMPTSATAALLST
jgi:tetratricopeptide (TPR) repeat protein